MIVRTRALLLRKVALRESDLVVTLFTEQLGKVSALARSARRSKTRFGGSLEPFHVLVAELDTRKGGDLLELREARLEQPRIALTESLPRLHAAGRALAWVRKAAPERQPEPAAYRALSDFLDALDQLSDDGGVGSVLAITGLRLLSAFGWGLIFDHCVGCATARPPGKPAHVDPARGGVVCSACGAGGLLLEASLLTALAGVDSDSPIPSTPLREVDAEAVLRLVERTLTVHGNVSGLG